MNSIKVLSWNIRGLNNEVAKRNLRDLVIESKSSIVCVQETKIAEWSQHHNPLQANKRNFEMVYQPSVGKSGGLVTFWDDSQVECIALAQCASWIWLNLRTKRECKALHVINIYSPLKMKEKKVLWKDIESILGCIEKEPACFIGDFNCIRSEEERLGCDYARRDIVGFNNLIESCNLMEINMVNASFTWFGSEGKKSRLDRALVDTSWFEMEGWRIKALSKKHSDDKALILESKDVAGGPKPFRIFNCYLTDELMDGVRANMLGE